MYGAIFIFCVFILKIDDSIDLSVFMIYYIIDRTKYACSFTYDHLITLVHDLCGFSVRSNQSAVD